MAFGDRDWYIDGREFDPERAVDVVRFITATDTVALPVSNRTTERGS